MARNPKSRTNVNATNDLPAPEPSPTPGEINSTATVAPEANTDQQTAMPLASIDVELQGDFPLELGSVEARATKPDGSEVVVSTKGKYRRSAPNHPWVDTIILSE